LPGQDQTRPYHLDDDRQSRTGGSAQAENFRPQDTPSGPEPLPDQDQTRPYHGGDRPATRHGLPEIVRAFKSFSARRINVLRRTPGVPVWQRNYYEHIIRSEPELEKIREYIDTNPQKWEEDQLNPSTAANELLKPK
jgi:hypothetical protein